MNTTETVQIIRYEKETTQKIFNFCKDRYPEIDWSYSKECLKKDYLIAYIIGSYFLLKLELKIDKDWLKIEYIQGYLSLQDINFRGYFLIQLNNDKNSKLEFYGSDFDETTKPFNENWNLRKKAKKIMREIFGFIEDEIQ